jgi:hypothetical protein
MEAFCKSCKFSFAAKTAGEGQAVKCPVCGRPVESGQSRKNKRQALQPGEHECSCCGKVLGKDVRYCTACGTNNYDPGEQLAGVAKHLGKATRKRALEDDTGVLKMIKGWFGIKW